MNNTTHGGGATVRYPIFWNEKYQSHFETFLTELASHIDTMGYTDHIEYIRVTGYSVGTTEPSFYNNATAELKPQLETLGMAFQGNKPYLRWANSACQIIPEGRACRKYAIATKAFWDMYIATFPNIPLAVTARFPEDVNGPNYNYYSGYNTGIANNFGLGSTTDVILNTAWQTKTCEMTTLRTSLSALQTSTLKVGFGDVHCTIAFANEDQQCCMKVDLAREGLGITGTGLYSPRSLASYLTLGEDRWPNPADTAVWTWADGQLGSFTGSTPTDCDPACSLLTCGGSGDTCTTPDPDNERDYGVD